MRDLALTVLVFGSLPFILWRPHIGVLVFIWLGIMNPQYYTWGFGHSIPYSLIVAVTTLVSLLFTREQKNIPWTRETAVLLAFFAWIVLTTATAEYQAAAWRQLEKVTKILVMIFVTMMVLQSRARIQLLVWVIVLSLAFYGVKGGIFTLWHGGVHHVWGPGGFISENNALALALIMGIPLMRYLQSQASSLWLSYALMGVMVLTALAAIGSQSRGAMLGLAAMGTFLWIKSRNKILTGSLIAVAIVLVVSTMPQQWFDRMNTIRTYEADSSAMGRINAWMMAFNLALDKPLGGGFETFRSEMFVAYAPNPSRQTDAHSIYFEVLGEHGFGGLALFLALGLFTWRSASTIIRRCRKDPRNRWAAELAAMVQVSLIGYGSAGAFLGLAYFDLYYTMVALIVLCKVVLLSEGVRGEPERAGSLELAPGGTAGYGRP